MTPRPVPTFVFAIVLATIPLAGCLQGGGDGLSDPAEASGWPVLTSATLQVIGEEDPVQVRFREDLKAPDETGATRDWPALTWTDHQGEVDALLLDPASGCIRGISSARVLEAGDNAIGSRFTEYFLGRSEHLFSRETEGIELRTGILLLQLGAVARMQGADTAEDLVFFDDAVVDDNGDRIHLSFVDDRWPIWPTAWNVTYHYADDGVYPTRVDWQWVRTGPETGYLSPTRSNGSMEVTTMEVRPGSEALSCGEMQRFHEPRVPPRRLTDEDVPAPDPVPAGYPMAQAVADAKTMPAYLAFKQDYPDARFAFTWVTTGTTVDSNQTGVYRMDEIRWGVAFVSPKEEKVVSVRVGRDYHYPGGLHTEWRQVIGYGAADYERGLLPEPAYERKPLVSASQVLKLARETGLEPNRLAWTDEYAEEHYPKWYVAWYHPRYGQAPGNTRTGFHFDAETGWIAFSAINTQITDVDG